MVVTQLTLDGIKSDVLTDIQSSISHIAVGDDTTLAGTGDTALGNETYRDALLSESVVGDIYYGDIFLDTSENNSNNIKEVGSFNQASGGTMFSRALSNTISKTSSVEATIELNIELEALNT